MKQITGHNNFIRIYKLPSQMGNDYCFGGGYNIPFRLVDWFNPIQDLSKVSDPDYIEDEHRKTVQFIKQKNYVKKGDRLLLITDYDWSLVVDVE